VINPDRPCDLCALPVGVKPFVLRTPDKSLEFCCEGCLGIYQMLHDIKEAPPEPGHNNASITERSRP
jgi:hypothetical protein